MKKLLNNKKLLAGIIILIIILIVGIIFFSTRKINIKSKNNKSNSLDDSTEVIYKAIDKTLYLDSFKLYISDDYSNDYKRISVERDTEAGTMEASKTCFFGYNTVYIDDCEEEEEYSVNGALVEKDDEFVFNNESDNYHYYYQWGYASGYSRGYDKLLNNLLEKLKTYKYKKTNNEYLYDEYIFEPGNDKELGSILNELGMGNIEDQTFPYVYVTTSSGYINNIKVPYAYYYDNGIEYEPTVYSNISYFEISLIYLYHDKIEIPDKIKSSLAHNYYNFVTYGFDQSQSNGAHNSLKTYVDKTKVCPNGESKISFNVGHDIDYKVYFEFYDCSESNESISFKKLYIKNTSEDFNPLSNHKDDVYNLYDKETNKLIGKLKYDGNNTMTIFDSQGYNGNYVNNDK